MKLKVKSVSEIDHEATGHAARGLRLAKKITLRDLAKSLHLSAAYLSDLELGKRNWTQWKLDEYSEALRK